MARHLRILLVDDNKDEYWLIEDELRRGGFQPEIRQVESASAMLEALEERPWDLLLVDWNMPQFSAPRAFELYQQSGSDCPFIILSGLVDESVAVAMMEGGVHDFISKDNRLRLLPAIRRELGMVQRRRLQRESEQHYQAIFQGALCAIWQGDVSELWAALEGLRDEGVHDLRACLEGQSEQISSLLTGVKTTDVNPATLKLFEAADLAEMVSGVERIATPDLQSLFIEILCALWAGAEQYVGEARFRSLTGRELTLLLSMALPHSVEASRQITISLIDITGRKQAELQREQSLAALRDRMRELRCLFRVTELLHVTRDLPDALERVVELLPAGWQYPEEAEARVVVDGKGYGCETRGLQGQWQSSEITVGGVSRGVVEVGYRRPLPECDEGPFLQEERDLVDSVARSISGAIERREAEREQERLSRELHQAHKMEALGQLTGGIAHDFNNILGIILGYAEFARDHCAGEGQTQLLGYIGQIERAGERARDLVAQMLAFSHKQSGDDRPLRLRPLVREDLDMLRSILPATITINAELEENLPPVWMDTAQFSQVMMNLCVNARDAMAGKGELTIHLGWARGVNFECSACHHWVTGDWVEFSIRDVGSGISPQRLKHIFDPFFTTKEIGKGTGMGLAVIHGIMRSHGGHIAVESTPGRGTCFRLLFPPVAEESSSGVPSKPEATQGALPQGHGERILVVDDEPDLSELLGDMLEYNGYQVDVLSSSTLALERFSEAPEAFALLITDQTMPELSGLELIAQVRSLRPQLPVILSSGYSEQVDLDSIQRMDVVFLRKPINGGEMIRTVARLLHSE